MDWMNGSFPVPKAYRSPLQVVNSCLFSRNIEPLLPDGYSDSLEMQYSSMAVVNFSREKSNILARFKASTPEGEVFYLFDIFFKGLFISKPFR